jgi:hypothetical protein
MGSTFGDAILPIITGSVHFASRFCSAPKRSRNEQIHPSGIEKPTVGEYNLLKCDTGRFDIMPLSLRIPPEKEKMINRAATLA